MPWMLDQYFYDRTQINKLFLYMYVYRRMMSLHVFSTYFTGMMKEKNIAKDATVISLIYEKILYQLWSDEGKGKDCHFNLNMCINEILHE